MAKINTEAANKLFCIKIIGGFMRRIVLCISVVGACLQGLSHAAFAQDNKKTVELIKFQYINTREPFQTLAEVCGVVKGDGAAGTQVHLIVDPSGNPGNYMTIASPNGNFCTIVNSYTGRLQYGLVGEELKSAGLADSSIKK
ncbi:MAG: hypothetical protein ACOYOK_04810 [Pseudobdellovibrionaceae bacterium]